MTQITRTTPEQVDAARARMNAVTQQRREEGAIAKALLDSMWGSNIDEHVARGLARYCRTHAIDAAEIDVLGGNPYLNTKLYRRRLVEQVGADAIQYMYADHVEFDPRLVEMMNEPIPDGADERLVAELLEQRRWARHEHFRRKQQRISHGLSDAAPAAVVYRLRLHGNAEEFVGADECGLKKKKKVRKRNGEGWFEVDADPVGDEHPRKTAETRAARRCLMQVVNTFPALSARLKAEEAGLSQVMLDIAQEEARTPIGRRPVPMLTGGEAGAEDPYDAPSAEVVEEAEETPRDPRPAEVAALADSPRTKAQRYNLERVLDSQVFTDAERRTALDRWTDATHGEMEALIAEMKQVRLAREKSARPVEDAAA